MTGRPAHHQWVPGEPSTPTKHTHARQLLLLPEMYNACTTWAIHDIYAYRRLTLKLTELNACRTPLR